MRDLLAVVAGAATAVSLAAAFAGLTQLPRRVRFVPPLTSTRAAARERLAAELDRAGWHETPERLTVLVVAIAAGVSAGLAAIALPLAPAGPAVTAAGALIVLNGSIKRRRRRLAGELVPLLELFTLELSGGGSALSALGSVTMQVESGLAADLRQMLIAGQVAGSASFEGRLIDYSQRVRLPALASLATIMTASREFGTGASQGVRALATDLRRAQRRELIEHSRRALNHVLLPAAVCILLPFLSVLMFPAVSVLQRSLR